jgi:hypothetical protein
MISGLLATLRWLKPLTSWMPFVPAELFTLVKYGFLWHFVYFAELFQHISALFDHCRLSFYRRTGRQNGRTKRT